MIDCAQVVDVHTFCYTPPSGDLCSPGSDPWCSETFVAHPDDPWVVLARIEVGASGILTIDNYACRRMVVSFAASWCSPAKLDTGEGKYSCSSMDDFRLEIIRRTDLEDRDLTRPEDMVAARFAAAVRLRGVTPGGRLGRKLENEDLTIQDVGKMPEETFVKLVSRGVPKAGLESFQDQARKVWSYAADVVRLTEME